MTVQTSDPLLAEIRQTQAQTLMQLSEMKGQHPAEIDPVLAEEILSGEVAVEGFTPAITVTPTRTTGFPWAVLALGAGLGAGAVMISHWVF